MAKIEDLIAQIPDDRLRTAVAGEVKALKKTKRFGLVFEEHLPETVRLPRLPVHEGELVALKRESGNQLWRVKSVRKDIVICEREVESFPPTREVGKEFPISDLIVVRNFRDPIYPALVPVDRVQRGGPDKAWHVLINADNFHALQLLLYCYEGKVDVIYIDPPYNTGARDWKYNNDYVDKNDTFRHSKWLSMMKKRLRLAKQLLKPDGVFIVTIDEHEVHHLGNLLEEELREYSRQMVTIVINQRELRRGACPGSRNTLSSVSLRVLLFRHRMMTFLCRTERIKKDSKPRGGSGCCVEALTHSAKIASNFSFLFTSIQRCLQLLALANLFLSAKSQKSRWKVERRSRGQSVRTVHLETGA